MPYTADWDETIPLDHSKFKSQPGYVRNTKRDVAERVASIIYGFTSGETDMSTFKQLYMKSQGSNPTVAAGFLSLFAKTVAGKSELHIKTEDAIVRQLSKLGAWIGELGKGANVASAATCDIWAGADGDYIHVTGTTTITALGTAPHAGAERTVIFDGALTLTHHATNLIIPGGANITTAAGDRMIVRAETTTTFRVIAYIKADGTATVVSSIAAASQAEEEAASSTTVYTSPGRSQYHPGVAKAWVRFDGTGTPTIIGSRNVASITDNGVGDYTINLSITMADTNFMVLGCVGNGAATTLRGVNIYARTTTSVQITVQTAETNALADCSDVNVAIFGDI